MEAVSGTMEKEKRKTDVKEDYALILLIKELFSQIDEVSALRKTGAKANISFGLLQEMAKVLREIDDEVRERYLELLVLIGAESEQVTTIPVNEEYILGTIGSKERLIERLRTDLVRVKQAG